MTTALVKHKEEAALATGQMTREQADLLKNTVCKGASDDEFALAVQIVNRTQLDPFARQIYFIKRWDSASRKEVMSPQISIDGARLIAERSNKYAGQVGPYWCGSDGKWVDIWLAKAPPVAAKVAVVRSDFKEPLWAVARYDGYCQTNKEGKPTPLWAKMPDLMLAKCAESLALRKAFPFELSGLYTVEEMGQAATETIEVQFTQPEPEKETPAPTQVHSLREEPEFKLDWAKVSELTEALGWKKSEVQPWAKERMGMTFKEMKQVDIDELTRLMQEEFDNREKQEVA